MTSFISYAQRAEEVVLRRALGEIANGCCIDVGAADPDAFSVTVAFSRRGGREIGIESGLACASKLRAARPRDLTLELALGAAPELAVFQRRVGIGLSTMNGGIAADHAKAGFGGAEPLEVEVATLANICAQYVINTI